MSRPYIQHMLYLSVDHVQAKDRVQAKDLELLASEDSALLARALESWRPKTCPRCGSNCPDHNQNDCEDGDFKWPRS